MRYLHQSASIIKDQHAFVRNLQGSVLLEDFIISAVVAVLGIRLYLELASYPQLGGGGIHIAHMLWGGLGMLVALVIVLEFVNRAAREWAAVIGGIGFGTFIDELGKFVTSDNNYFYQPTAAMIYVIFVILFLAARWLNRPRLQQPDEAIANVLEIMKEGILRDGLDPGEERLVRELLARGGGRENPLAAALADALPLVGTVSHAREHILTRIRRWFARSYRRWANGKWFARTVTGIMMITAAGTLIWIAMNLLWTRPLAAEIAVSGLALWALLQYARAATTRRRVLKWSLACLIAGSLIVLVVTNLEQTPNGIMAWLMFICAAVSGILVLPGAAAIRRSRLAAFRWFRRSVIVSILLTEVFMFYEYQFIALADLGVSLLLLLALRYMIAQEEGRLQEQRPGNTP